MQKFTRGDVVHIAKSLGSSMSHFDSDVDAVVIGSYRDQYGGGPDNEKQYTLLFYTGGKVSWYYESQLTFLRHGGEAEIEKIEREKAARDAHDSDLDWFVAHWPEIRERPPSATIHALAGLAGYSVDELWGKHGEGIDYYSNTRQIWQAFDPVLLTGDIEAVRAFGQTLKIRVYSNNLSGSPDPGGSR